MAKTKDTKMYGKDMTTFITDVFTPGVKDASREMLEREWFRNILYYLGEQYIEWYETAKTFRRSNKINPFTPTPVSNILRDYVRSMKALILNKEYSIKIYPNSNSMEDREAAKLGEQLLNSMDLDFDEEFKEEKDKVAMWMIITGTAFMRTFPMIERGKYGIDSNGKLIPSGDIASENIIPFNVVVDQFGDKLSDKRWVGIKSLKSKEWVEDTFKQTVNSDSTDMKLNYQRRLMQLVANVSPWKGIGLTHNSIIDMDTTELCVFQELEFRPTKEYPEGRYVVSANDNIILLDSQRLPIPVKDNSWYYTLTDFHYLQVPGRYWSDGGINDLISPQTNINEIDQAIAINRKSLGRPILFLPIGKEAMNLERVSAPGQQFIAVKYDPRTSGGQPPKIDRGTPLPDQIFKEREVHRNTAQDAAGDPNHVLRGGIPGSNASGVLVDMLQEAAERGHTPDIRRFYLSLKKVYRKRLILAEELYSEKRILKIATDASAIDVKMFKSSDLRSNDDVRLELTTGISSTKTGQTQTMINLAKEGFFGDLTQDPSLRQELLRRIGLGNLPNTISVDTNRAEMEHEKIKFSVKDDKLDGNQIKGIMLAMPDPQSGELVVVNDDPLFKLDNHKIHYETHRNFILSPQFQDLKPEAQTVLIAHTDLHKQLMDAMQQAQMQMEQGVESSKQMPSESEAQQPVEEIM
jgi:hypothetical protein